MWICSWIWIYFPFLPTGVKTKSKSVGNWQKRAQWKQKPKIQCVWLFVQKVHGIAFESPEIKNHPLGAFNQPAAECNSQFSTRILINFLFLPPFFLFVVFSFVQYSRIRNQRNRIGFTDIGNAIEKEPARISRAKDNELICSMQKMQVSTYSNIAGNYTKLYEIIINVQATIDFWDKIRWDVSEIVLFDQMLFLWLANTTHILLQHLSLKMALIRMVLSTFLTVA